MDVRQRPEGTVRRRAGSAQSSSGIASLPRRRDAMRTRTPRLVVLAFTLTLLGATSHREEE